MSRPPVAPIVDFAQGALAKMTGDVGDVGERLDLTASYEGHGKKDLGVIAIDTVSGS